MRIPVWITLLAALFGLALVLVVGLLLINPDEPLIVEAGFSLQTITPNADGEDDITIFTYTLSRNAWVSLIFEDDEGNQFTFRDSQRRVRNDYRVEFSGVVNGYVLPGEEIPGIVERRLIPDGEYTWRLIAEDMESDEVAEKTGTLTIQDADVPLPVMTTFDLSLDTFTPNQDGIDDRVEVHVYLEKEADLTVFLVDGEGNEFPISALKEGRLPGEAGRHIFDYEGGVDLGADPPEDGTYKVVALAQDAEGQRTRRETTLTIKDGGNPLAEIVPQFVGVDVVFDVQPYEERFFSDANALGDLVDIPGDPSDRTAGEITMPVGEMLVFKLTVENYSDVPIRTSGPPPGTVYQQDQISGALGFFDESGAWRVGIECQTSMTSFPWRWAIGTEDDLVAEYNENDGNTYYYLPAGTRSVVWGAVRFTEIEDRNPQNCWAGLIHEDVEISLLNNNVGSRPLRLVDVSGDVGD